MNWALLRRLLLEARDHYPMSMTLQPGHWWFNLARSKMASLASATGEQFCIVLIGNHDVEDDYYVIPYPIVKPLLTEETLADPAPTRPQPRWHMYLRGDELGLWPGQGCPDNHLRAIDVSCYRGRRELLQRLE